LTGLKSMDVTDSSLNATAPAAPIAAGCWQFASDEADGLLRGAVRAPLHELGVITVAGEDAVRFLHGQLSNDVEHLGDGRLALAGYCSAKGRLLATFRMWREAQAVHLLLPRELLPGVLRRLSMFVLRAKAKLTDESAAWRAWAVLGAGAGTRLRALGIDPPAVPGESVRLGTARVARLHGSARLAERFLAVAPAADATQIEAMLAEFAAVGSGAFWWSEIDAGVPTVFAATQEKFVPQMINFEVLGGVSFSKGCYPGQEVVARSQYRGKLKRRMQLAHCVAAAPAGADVFAEGDGEPAGTVVMSASAPGDGFDLLFECPLEKADAPLHLGAADGPPLALRALPYELVDVTA
jgi:folate-binding protein YgfZ